MLVTVAIDILTNFTNWKISIIDLNKQCHSIEKSKKSKPALSTSIVCNKIIDKINKSFAVKCRISTQIMK